MSNTTLNNNLLWAGTKTDMLKEENQKKMCYQDMLRN
jgi:hypothetical protein